MKILLLLLVTLSFSFAECSVVKKTYLVTEGPNKCSYSTTWKGGWDGQIYETVMVNKWISVECVNFNKPLKGKVIKKEIISETTRRNCVYKTK